MHPECRSVGSVHWAVEKMFAQTEMTYGKSRVIMVDIKILLFFFSLGGKEENFEGYCRYDRPSSIYIYIYIGSGARSEDT